LEVYFKGQKIKECALRRRLSLVGRRRPCTLLIEDGGISMCHGAFYWRHKKLWFIDFLSSNGTKRDAQNVEATSVQVGDRLELGNIELRFARISSSDREEREHQTSGGAEPQSPDESVDASPLSDSRDSSDPIVDLSGFRQSTAIPNLGEAESRDRGDMAAAVVDRAAAESTDATRKVEVPITFLKREPTYSQADESPTSLRVKVKNSPPKPGESRDVATAPSVEAPNEGRSVDPLDESLEYVLNRLVSRDQKSQRKVLVGRLLAALVLFGLLIAGAIVVSFWS
jgi:pSer/pThr/pTyr-binding forkhead associated (FHA) protein